jgi:hypothetical protein
VAIYVLTAVGLTLVTTAALSQPSQPRWTTDLRTQCRLWNPDPKPNETVLWFGDCVNGVANGRGVAQWFVDGKLSERDEGELRDGKSNGLGSSQAFADGEVVGRYDGQFRDGAPNGHGVFQWFSHGKLTAPYDGESLDGNKEGRGVETLADGRRYEGEWHDNKPNGVGQYKDANGVVAEGVWVNGCFRNGTQRAAIGVKLSTCP